MTHMTNVMAGEHNLVIPPSYAPKSLLVICCLQSFIVVWNHLWCMMPTYINRNPEERQVKCYKE